MRRLLAWLNSRFPEKLEITMTEYKQLREEMAQYNVHGQQILDLHSRLVKIESNLSQLNVANGFITNAKGLGARLER